MMTEDLAGYLVSAGVFTGINTDVFLDCDFPLSPSLCVTLSQYAGGPRSKTFDNPGSRNPGLQVKGRGEKGGFNTIYALMEEVNDHIDGLANTTINGNFYEIIYSTQDIIPLGYDEQPRQILVQNYAVRWH
jgi:hypothetical protein